jgi:hypothetical protein
MKFLAVLMLVAMAGCASMSAPSLPLLPRPTTASLYPVPQQIVDLCRTHEGRPCNLPGRKSMYICDYCHSANILPSVFLWCALYAHIYKCAAICKKDHICGG